jgi:hypothetical protein
MRLHFPDFYFRMCHLWTVFCSSRRPYHTFVSSAPSLPSHERSPFELSYRIAQLVVGAPPTLPTKQVRSVVGGSTCSLFLTASRHLYFCGKLSNSKSGEAIMYPKIQEGVQTV